MQTEKGNAQAAVSAGLVGRGSIAEAIGAPHFRYTLECRRKDGSLRWREEFSNLVTTEGKNDLLTKYFKGSGYTAAWYLGLISSVSYSAVDAGDTAAEINDANGWKEADSSSAPDYDESARPALSFGSASSGTLATASAAQFTFAESGTVKGAFISSSSTKGGTSGVLYSAGTFASDREVQEDDVLNVSVSLSV